MVSPEGDFDGEAFTGDLSGQDAGNARFIECEFRGCDLTGFRAPRARFAECVLHAVHGAGVDLAETAWMDSTVSQVRLGAVQLYGAELRRVSDGPAAAAARTARTVAATPTARKKAR